MKKTDDLNDYEILDVDAKADAAEIHMAYIRARQALEPGSLAHYSLVSEEEKEKLRVKIEMAYHRLMDQKKREEYSNRYSKDWETPNKITDVSSQTQNLEKMGDKSSILPKKKHGNDITEQPIADLNTASELTVKETIGRKIASKIEKITLLFLLVIGVIGLLLFIRTLFPQ
jgi:DnaJ-class molecular chaperone